jgi:hypothetical protein
MAKTAEQVLEENESRLMALPGVEGIGIGGSEEQPEIIVMVRRGLTEMRNQLPARLDGYPVRVEASGEITAF